MVEGEGAAETAECCKTEALPPTTTPTSAEHSAFLSVLTRRSPGAQAKEHTGLPPRNVAIDRVVPHTTLGTTTDVTVTVYFKGEFVPTSPPGSSSPCGGALSSCELRARPCWGRCGAYHQLHVLTTAT